MKYDDKVKDSTGEKAWRKAGEGKLWAVEHPYHCNQANFHNTNSPEMHLGWSSFYDEFHDADPDMNLIFRWDWEPAGPDWNGNETPTLLIFMIHQRKGRFVCHRIEDMKAEDEPAVRKLLMPHWQLLNELWAPLPRTNK